MRPSSVVGRCPDVPDTDSASYRKPVNAATAGKGPTVLRLPVLVFRIATTEADVLGPTAASATTDGLATTAQEQLVPHRGTAVVMEYVSVQINVFVLNNIPGLTVLSVAMDAGEQRVFRVQDASTEHATKPTVNACAAGSTGQVTFATPVLRSFSAPPVSPSFVSLASRPSLARTSVTQKSTPSVQISRTSRLTDAGSAI